MISTILTLFVLGQTNQSDLEKRIAEVVPTAKEERWLQIPWRTNIMEARQEAQQKGKPLFLWVMNGNPLGCT